MCVPHYALSKRIAIPKSDVAQPHYSGDWSISIISEVSSRERASFDARNDIIRLAEPPKNRSRTDVIKVEV